MIFSDEKEFILYGPDGSESYWGDLRKESQYFRRRNFGGGLSWRGLLSARQEDGNSFLARTNSADYVEIL